MTKVRLHLGCGLRKIHGFTNIDILPSVEPDLTEDIFTLPSFTESSVDEIYCCHAIEHVGRREYMAALRRWHRVLVRDGKLRIAVPDIHAAMMLYLKNGNLREIHGFLWGGQRDEYDHHSIGWDEKTLRQDLEEAGFVNVKRYDWRKTSHWYVDDYSQAYYPHLDKQNGTLMSLNVEAQKPPLDEGQYKTPSFNCEKCGRPPHGYSAPDLYCRCEDGPKMSPEAARYRDFP